MSLVLGTSMESIFQGACLLITDRLSSVHLVCEGDYLFTSIYHLGRSELHPALSSGLSLDNHYRPEWNVCESPM